MNDRPTPVEWANAALEVYMVGGKAIRDDEMSGVLVALEAAAVWASVSNEARRKGIVGEWTPLVSAEAALEAAVAHLPLLAEGDGDG